MAQLIRSELTTLLLRGIPTRKPISENLRRRISIVDVQMSKNLASARVFVSTFGDSIDKRTAYSWLVKHSKLLRHGLARELKDMRRVPELFFKESDVMAAVDVMVRIDEIAKDEGRDYTYDVSQDMDDPDFEYDWQRAPPKGARGKEGAPRGVIKGLDFDDDTAVGDFFDMMNGGNDGDEDDVVDLLA